MGKILHMSPADIFKEYREAKDPKEQIKILADENICGAREIIDVLISFGVNIKQRKKIKPSVWTEEQIKKVEDMYLSGVKDSEIAKEFNTSVINLRQCVIYKYGMHKKKKALGVKGNTEGKCPEKDTINN